jgi:hypothetical protein
MTILEQFLSTDCPACAGVKEKHTAFCQRCYRKLPRELQGHLWRRFGNGFELAYREGLTFLTKQNEGSSNQSATR